MAEDVRIQVQPTIVPDPSKAPADATATSTVDPKTGLTNTRVTINSDKPDAGAPADRPTWLPEKFKTPEDLAKSYAELERKLGQGGTATAPVPAVTPAPAGTTAPAIVPAVDPAAAPAVAAAAGLDMESLTTEYATNGGMLTPESMAKLKAAGFSEHVVGQHIAGLEALRTQKIGEIERAAGGKPQMDAALAWAGTNLSKAEIDSINGTFKTGDVAAASLAMLGVVSRMQATLGSTASLVTGAGVPGTASGVEPFLSNGEVVEAMRNPKYKTSETYRRQVAARLDVSSFAGVPARKR